MLLMAKALLLSLLSSLLFLTNQLECSAQFVTNHDALPQPDIQKPEVGRPFTDPVFGTQVVRLTDAVSSGFEGVLPNYSKRQAWNADETLMYLCTGDGNTLLYDGQTYKFKKKLDRVGGEDIFWHPTNPAIIYYNGGNTLHAYNVETDEEKLICSFPDYTFAYTRGEGNLSIDGRYYAVVGELYNFQTGEVTPKDLILFDLVAQQIVSKQPLPNPLGDFDWVSVSPKGNYVVVNYATDVQGPFNGVEVYDKNFNRLWQKPLGAGHGDLGIDENGDEILVMGIYDTNTNSNFIKKYRLSDGQETILLEYNWIFYSHISCRDLSQSGWCIVSTYDSPSRLTDDPASWLPFDDEIFALKLDGSGQVRRLAHHHSRRFSPSTPDGDHSVYYAEPHATASPRGDRILFGSNWREGVELVSSVDAYIVDIRQLLNPQGNFALGIDTVEQNIQPGGQVHIQLTVLGIANFSQPVTLSASISPADGKVSADFSTNPVLPGGATEVTLSAAADLPSSQYTIIFTAVSGPLKQTVTALLDVSPTAADYRLRLDPATLTVNRGQTASVTVNIDRFGGFAGNVTIGPDDTRPLKIKISPPSNSTTGNGVVFTLKVKKKAPTGEQHITFTGRDDSGRVRTDLLTLMIQ